MPENLSVITVQNVLRHFDFIQFALGTTIGISFNHIALSLTNDIVFPLIENFFNLKALDHLVWYNMEIGKFLVNLIYFSIIVAFVFLVIWKIMAPYVADIIKDREKPNFEHAIENQILPKN